MMLGPASNCVSSSPPRTADSIAMKLATGTRIGRSELFLFQRMDLAGSPLGK
jgi:hypothetical protein